MSKICKLLKVLARPRELRMALGGLCVRLDGDKALGGLTDEETEGLVGWVKKSGVPTFVEIGTLFGFTARAVAQRTEAKVLAVDIFCWNPFGLTGEEHERFTRKVLEDSRVELIRRDSQDFLKSMDVGNALVFLDGDHRYAAVKAELEILKSKGVRHLAGHDFGNSLFGVTRAVREVIGEPDEVIGMCWYKRI